MSSKHSFFVAAACALPLSLAACGSVDGESLPVPEGPHYGYVVSKASVPSNPAEVNQFGLDLGGMKSSKQDGAPENKLGMALSTLAMIGFKVQDAVTAAIDQGSIILLVDVQTKDLQNSSAAGFSVKIGANPRPPACSSASDTVCRHHLDGHGMFDVATSSPTDAVVAGKIVGGAFTGGPGEVTVQITLGGDTPITLNLQRARVQATISATGIMNATVGGLLTQTEIATGIIPVIQVQANNLLSTSCTGSGQNCGCTGTAALFLIGLDSNSDCRLSTDELLNSTIVQTAFGPDVCTTDSCTTPDGVSVGVQVQAVKAAFPDVM